MAEIWIGITGIIILFIFWRQLIILKMAQKINYAPLVLVIGSISSISLFVFSSSGEFQNDIKYALIPLLISLVFYMLMYIMNQMNINRSSSQRESHEHLLSTLIADISGYFGVLDEKLSAIVNTDEKTLQAVQMALRNELSEFTQISKRQELISKKIEDMYTHEEAALLNIQKFIEKDVIDLDKVLHRHIDILRVSEQDHFNKLQNRIDMIDENRKGSDTNIVLEEMNSRISKMQESFERSASLIIENTKTHLSEALKKMHSDLGNTKQLSEALYLSTQEYEVKLNELHKQASLLLQKSDIIHESMADTFEQSKKVRPVYNSLNELISRLMDIYAEYKHAKKELNILAGELGNAEERHFELMDAKIDILGENIHKKIEASLKELKEHYHIADRDVTSTVKTLAAKAQLQKSYSEE